MATVTIHDTGTDTVQVSPPAKQVDTVVTDSLGRRLTIREPNLLQESRLVKTLGEHSENRNYFLSYVMPAAMVVKIDDEDVPFPLSERQVDAAIQRLDREGVRAVYDYIMERAKEKQDAEKAVGKWAGTPDSGQPVG